MAKPTRLAMVETFLIAILATIYVLSFFGKLIGGHQFIEDLSTYGFTGSLATLVFVLVLWVEMWTVLLLLSSKYRHWGAMMVVITQILFISVTGIAQLRGLQPHCDCFGPIFQRTVNWLFYLEDGLIGVGGVVLFLMSRNKEQPRVRVLPAAAVTSIMVTCALILMLFTQTQQVNAFQHDWQGKTLADVQLGDQQNPVPLTRLLNNRAALVMFFSPSCSHCIKTLERIAEIERSNPNVHQVFIDVTGDQDKAIKALNSFSLLGQESSATRPQQFHTWTPHGVPVLFFVDSNGVVKTALNGEVDSETLRAQIATLQ